MNKVKNKAFLPKLRFPEFAGLDDWKVKPLKKYLIFQTGFPFDSDGFNEDGNGIRLIKNRDLKSDDKVVYYRKPFKKEFLVKNGDILIGMDGDFTPCTWEKGEALLNQRVGRVISIVKGKERFFLYFLTKHLKSIEEKTARTTVKHLSHSDIEKIQEPLPENPVEQQKIADCLSSLDDLISAESQKLDVLKDHKTGLMQQLFPAEGEKEPQLRFPEFRGSGEWLTQPFKEIYSFISTNSFSRDKLNEKDGYVKNIHYGDIHTKYQTLFDITKESVPYIDSNTAIKKIKSDCYCREGDLVLADASEDLEDVGKSIEIIFLNNEKLLSGLHTILARQINKKFVIGFGGYLFKSEKIRLQIKKESQGAKVLGISPTRLAKINISYPSDRDEQKAIVNCLTFLDSLIKSQNLKIDNLKDHKKGLMQQLFPDPNEV